MPDHIHGIIEIIGNGLKPFLTYGLFEINPFILIKFMQCFVYYCSTISTLLFLAFPSSVELLDTGAEGPTP